MGNEQARDVGRTCIRDSFKLDVLPAQSANKSPLKPHSKKPPVPAYIKSTSTEEACLMARR